jgi:hypothetical protein
LGVGRLDALAQARSRAGTGWQGQATTPRVAKRRSTSIF